jgi:hypothetical protein
VWEGRGDTENFRNLPEADLALRRQPQVNDEILPLIQLPSALRQGLAKPLDLFQGVPLPIAIDVLKLRLERGALFLIAYPTRVEGTKQDSSLARLAPLVNGVSARSSPFLPRQLPSGHGSLPPVFWRPCPCHKASPAIPAKQSTGAD